MKKVFLAAAMILVSTSSIAAESWTAAGVRQVATSNFSTVQVMPVSESGFATEALCEQFIADQNALALANSVKGSKMFNHVDAKCSQAATN